MEINQYFEAYNPKRDPHLPEKLNSFIDFYVATDEFDCSAYDLVIIGVQEGRLSLKNDACAFAPDEIREELYKLYKGDWSLRVLDLGNLKLGATVQDTYTALKEISSYFADKKKKLVVLGGGHDLIKPIFDAYSIQREPLSFASADAYLDFQDAGNYNSKSFVSELVSKPKSLLSKYTLLAYQSYLCSPKEVSLLKDMDFTLVRLGDFNADYAEVEPYIRDLDHLSIDLSVVKTADAPANFYTSPNGLSAEGLCVLCRYAGMSANLKSILFSELNSSLDRKSQSAKVFAQSIWYFMEGLDLRYDDFPELSTHNFKKFHVSTSFSDLVFYKSSSSARWWVESPRESLVSKISLLPCSVNDYNKAVQGVLTERLSSQLKF